MEGVQLNADNGDPTIEEATVEEAAMVEVVMVDMMGEVTEEEEVTVEEVTVVEEVATVVEEVPDTDHYTAFIFCVSVSSSYYGKECLRSGRYQC